MTNREAFYWYRKLRIQYDTKFYATAFEKHMSFEDMQAYRKSRIEMLEEKYPNLKDFYEKHNPRCPTGDPTES